MGNDPVSIIQQSFAGGEWAPSLYARTDLAQYRTAVRTMKNFILNPHGYVSNRPGTYYVATTKDSTKVSRLIPFQHSAGDAYVLEVGHNYIRVISLGAAVADAPGSGTDIVTAAYKWTKYAVSGCYVYYLTTAAGGDPSLGEPLNVYEDVGGADITMTKVAPTYFPAVSTWQWAYVPGGAFQTICVRLADSTDPDSKAVGYLEAGYSHEIVTTYDEDDIFDIKFIQRGDVMYLVHPSYAVQKLTRTGAHSWTIASVTFQASQAAPTALTRSAGAGTGNNYVVTAVSADGEESVACTAVTNNGPGDTWTWTAASGAVYYNIYKDPNGSCGVYGWIGRATALTFTEPAAGIDPDFVKGPPIAQTVFNTTDERPGAVAFHQQRLNLARTNNDPQTIRGSVIGVYESFNKQIPLQDDDAYSFTLTEINQILWLASMRDLIVGTMGGVWKMAPSIDESTITPTNVIVTKEEHWPCANIRPLVIGNRLLYIDANLKVVRDFKATINIDGVEQYRGNDLAILASHLFEDYTIVDWSYQQYPDSVVWIVRSDGSLLGLTYFPDQQVWGWHQHETDGTFESVASILKDDGVYETYVIVNRTIDGSTVRYIEMFEQRLPPNSLYAKDIQDAFFVDCGLSYDYPFDISAATKADPCQITATGHGLSTDDYIDIVEVVGMTELNDTRFKVVRIDDNTITLKDEDGNAIDSSEYTTYVSGGKLRKCVTEISGLDHLEGEAVSVLANGVPVTGKTVTDGAITLTTRASRIHVGLGYTCDLETMDFHYEHRGGTTQDKVGNVASALVKLVNSASLQVGPDEDNLTTVSFEDAEFYNGNKEVMLVAGTHGDCRVLCRVTEPLPCQIIAIIARVAHGDH